jgi:superfamily II DNA or RNA helicase
VLSLDWDPEEMVLSATVVGNGALYETLAFFDGDPGEVEFLEGECSCPVGYDCKHVAAVVIAVAAGERSARPPRPSAGDGWEQPLRALVAARELPATGTALAIALGLEDASRFSGNGAPRLIARLMRPGARGGWVNGSLDWGGYHSWQLRNGGHRDDHIAIVQELYAIHRRRDSYDSYYSSERTIDLSQCDSLELWALLDRAARCELPLIHSHQVLGEVPPYEHGELVLDVTRRRTGFSLAAVLRLDRGSDLVPVRFIGNHGLVCAERADVDARAPLERWRLRLVRLARPAMPQLESMLLGGQPVAIPEGEIERFAEDLCPALRHIAPVVSSDGSFEPPEVSEPVLVFHARYGAGNQVEVGWAFRYEVGAASRRVPLGPGNSPAGFRDPGAERALLRSIELGGIGLERFGLVDPAGRPLGDAPVVLRAGAGLALSTEVLPLLGERPEVTVEIGGEPPDYRDVGESLSIGVSTGEIAGERDWFDLGVTISVEGRAVPFAEVFMALARGDAWLMLDAGAYFSLDDPRLQQLRRLIDEARMLDDPDATSLRISRYHVDLWSELVAIGVVEEQAERWQRVVAPLLELDSLPACELPRALRADLRDYQREGFGWLGMLWQLELGGILADDMGLGKTLQALALICHARERDAGPFLVVTPTSVAPNWADEAARFTPGLRVEVVLDTLARSGREIAQIASAEVVVTTYTLFRLDCASYQAVPWAGLILDEAQYVKNHRGKTYRCARELDAPFKLAITGTPMENRLMELWAMLSVVAPGLFPDPARFAEHYARPIERGGDSEQLARLRRRIKPLVKRRTKELVASELPPKQEQTLAVELHPRHRKIYDTHLQRERARVLALLDDFDRNRITILAAITRMRQLSLHPGLVDERHASVPCAKLSAFVEQLDDVVSSGHRALVFSQFTRFLTAVRERLDEEGIGYCYLDGSTRRRSELLERFRCGGGGPDPLFLISLKAGGVGLNLVEADYCFLLDPWWNPATETQAIDRAHRIGQTCPVMVYRLISRNTIEEKVRALAERKAELFHGVMDDGDLFARGLTVEDIRALLAEPADGAC